MIVSHAMGMRCLAAALVCLVALAGPARGAMVDGPGSGGGRALYVGAVMRAASLRGVPPALADAVAMVETGYRPDATGSAGEVGLMQILPATAAQLGFRGTLAELYAPATNIRFAVEYLGRAWALSGGNVCRALIKYRAGLGQEVMTPLSGRYCARALGWLAGTGSALARGAGAPPYIGLAPVTSDPYVIAIGPALAAQARQKFMQTSVHVWGPPGDERRTMAARTAALDARFNSHLRHSPWQSSTGPHSLDAAPDD